MWNHLFVIVKTLRTFIPALVGWWTEGNRNLQKYYHWDTSPASHLMALLKLSVQYLDFLDICCGSAQKNVVLPTTDMEQCKSKLRIIGFLYKISALQFAFYNRKKINSCMGEPKFVNINKSIKEIKHLGVVFLNKTILEVVRETSFI